MISPQAFFALVEAHLTGPMLAADYAKLEEWDEVTRTRGVVATRGGRLSNYPRLQYLLTRWHRGPRTRVFTVGYEGEDEAKWVHYTPGLAELDLSSWNDQLDGVAEWDVWKNRTVATVDVLEHRLKVVGAVMQDRTAR